MNGSANSLVGQCPARALGGPAPWADRNGSTRYSEKLDGLFRTALRVIATNPKLGRPTSDPDVRLKTIGDHMVFYSYTATEVHVLSVWHQKRDPKERPY